MAYLFYGGLFAVVFLLLLAARELRQAWIMHRCLTQHQASHLLQQTEYGGVYAVTCTRCHHTYMVRR
jgi:cytochrome c553